ncbi:MFS transporter [Arthrobacter sp. AG258]|uniref:MFS transporter n=1 Tax=Arthrobacter sp. AG258 TaxID=2183899 RepID=UPI001414FC16|nr:MFS transporter [Arthrobacter sp. AG258]
MAWAIYLGWIAITLDAGALNLALPTIGNQLHADTGSISWVIDAYTLPLASLLLLGGSLGDRIGAERMFRMGAIGFAVASVICALSPSLGLLIASRAAQGVSAALLLPMVLALVSKSFIDPTQRSRVVNMMTVFGGAGMAAGPFLGGLMTDTAGWRAVFWLTAPIAVAAAILVGKMPAKTAGKPHRVQFDAVGQVTGSAGLIALVAGLVESGRDTSSAITLTLLVAGVTLLAAFILLERQSHAPMMPMSVFRAPNFTAAVTGGFAFQFAAYGLQFFLALYVQGAWQLSALAGGMLLASFAIGAVLASVLVNPFLLPRGTHPMIIMGASAATVGTFTLMAAGAADRWWLLAAAELVIGAGTGIYSTALNKTASAALGAQSAGLASGIYNTARQVGQAVGIAVLGALSALGDQSIGFLIAIILTACCNAAVAGTAVRSHMLERLGSTGKTSAAEWTDWTQRTSTLIDDTSLGSAPSTGDVTARA